MLRCWATKIAAAPALRENPAWRTGRSVPGPTRRVQWCATHCWRWRRSLFQLFPLPPALVDQLQAAIQPAPAAAGWALLSSPRARIALVALPVLALIAFLVWPRGVVPPAPTGSAPALAQAPAPRDLVQRARDQLYIPP